MSSREMCLSTGVGRKTGQPALRKLKDRVGRLRIVERLDRLASGNPGDANRWDVASGNCD